MILAPLLVAVTLTLPDQHFMMLEEAVDARSRQDRRTRIQRRHRHWLRVHPLGSRAARAALSYVGVPYVYGAEGPGGFDCSGLVQYAYARVGKYIPRTTWAQEMIGRAVNFSTLRAGDLVFANGGGHVGMYVGNGNVVQAEHSGTTIMVTPLDEFGGEWVRRP